MRETRRTHHLSASTQYQERHGDADSWRALVRAASVAVAPCVVRRAAPHRSYPVMTWKERIQIFLDGYGGVALETFNVLLSVVLVVISVIMSYEHPDLVVTGAGYDAFEVACTLVFTVDFLLHWFAADNRLTFLFTPMAMIDLITIIPTFVTWFLRSLNVSILPVVRIIRVFRLLAVLRLYRIVRSYRGFDYELGVLIFMIFTVIFVAAGIFQILDEDYYRDNDLPAFEFHDAVYFVFVTISTVGYGDISPKTTASQFFVIAIICVVVTVIPRQVNRLWELSRLQHGYMHSYSIRKRGILNGGHVVVTGSISYESVSGFLAEFYRTRQGKVNMDVVILADQIPSERLVSLLRNVRYQRRTTYLKGSLLNEKDAHRAHVGAAAAEFILANRKKKIKHADAADALTILQALAVDKLEFCHRATSFGPYGRKQGHQHRRRGIRCFVQILSPQRTRGLRTITGVEVALNTPRLRTAILARSILCPGVTALILNLICSTPEEHVATAQQSNVPWINEYGEGLEHQLFPVILPRAYDGVQYEDALQAFYTNFNVLLIAVYDKFASQVGSKRIRLAPFGHVLHERDLAFFVAPSVSHAQHAVDSLSTLYNRRHDIALQRMTALLTPEDEFYGDETTIWPPTPTLIFSSDSVLARQSMVRDRAPSVALSSDEEADVDTSMNDEEDNDLEELVDEMNDDCDSKEVDDEANQKPPLAPPLISSSSSSSSLLSTPSIRLPPFLRQHSSSVLTRSADWSLSPAALRRLRDHIIICGPFAHGHQIAGYLDELYRIERSPALRPSGSERRARQSGRPLILLLVKRLPSDQDLENLSTPLPPSVFVERGVSQNVEDLLHVRAYLAKAVLMIPGNWKYHVDELRDETMDEVNEHLLDYQVIMSTLSLRTVQELHQEHLQRSIAKPKGMAMANRHCEPTIACSVVKWHDSLTYFAHKSGSYATHDFGHGATSYTPQVSPPTSGKVDRIRHAMTSATEVVLQREFPLGPPPSFAPSYAAGEVFVDSVLDALLCQSFFNPYVIDLIRALAGDYYYADHHTHTTPRAFVSSMMEHFQPPSQSQVSSSSASTQASSSSTGTTYSSLSNQDETREEDSEAVIGCPVLAMASLTHELEGKSFTTIFQHALRQQVLVLGIYRRANDPYRGNTLPYVYTCPKSHAGITVERGDMLHVLTRRIPPIVIRVQDGTTSR